jgi:mRNA-degrading endonuclease YafQ of YafQ-DinJ toxin-antitoxin module
MTLHKTPKYERSVKKIISSHALTKEEIEETEELFKKDPLTPSLRYHKIACKKDKYRHSITVPNTQYRILLTVLEDNAYCVALLNHKDYDRHNKHC